MAPGTPQGFILSPYKREVFEQIRPIYLFVCFLKIYLFIFLEWGEGREKEREKNINV